MNLPSIKDIRDLVLNRINLNENPSKSELYTLIDDSIYQYENIKYLPQGTINEFRYQVYNSIYGLDVLQEFIDDDSISEIMVNGYDNIFIERNGCIEKSNRSFDSQEKLIDTIQHIVALANRRVNEAAPITDSRLPDGSRVNIVSISKISHSGNGYASLQFVSMQSESDFNATLDVSDKAAPNMPTGSKEYTSSAVNININKPSDNGTTYSFKLETLDSSNNSVYNEQYTKDYTNISGVKGYYYYNDVINV